MDTIANRLKEALSLRNMKQADLVEKTGIGKSSISTYLSGAYEPKQKNIYKLAQALNVSESWLMGNDVPIDRISPFLKSKSIGNYDIIINTKDEANLIISYRSLDDINKQKSSSYIRNLLYNQKLENELTAAHERTDVPHTEEGLQHDLDIMNDPNW